MINLRRATALLLLLLFFPSQPSIAEQPLEDASYREGLKTIAEMHVLEQLGLAGQLITIYTALNKASYAAAILYDRKWRPGEDDLSWVDDPDYGKIRQDPLAGLSPEDKERVKRYLANIEYYNRLIERGDYANAAERDKYTDGIRAQIENLKGTLVHYRDFYRRAFPPANELMGEYSFDNSVHTLTVWQEGRGISGAYGETGTNTIDGSLTGTVLTGTYRNNEYKRDGTFELVFSLGSNGSWTVSGTWQETHPGDISGNWGLGTRASR